MAYFTYILQSVSSGHYYIGQTSDMQERMQSHNLLGDGTYSSRHRPWRVLASIEFSSRSSAIRAERYLKKKPRDFIQRVVDDPALRIYIQNKF